VSPSSLIPVSNPTNTLPPLSFRSILLSIYTIPEQLIFPSTVSFSGASVTLIPTLLNITSADVETA